MPPRVRSSTRSLIARAPSQLVLADAKAVRREPDGFEELLVCRAATQVARQRLAHGRVRGLGLPVQEVRDRDDEPGRAEPALDRARLDERLLHGMQGIATGQTLDRADLA